MAAVYCFAFSVLKRLIWAIKNPIREKIQIFHHKGGPLRPKSLKEKGQNFFFFKSKKLDKMEQENWW